MSRIEARIEVRGLFDLSVQLAGHDRVFQASFYPVGGASMAVQTRLPPASTTACPSSLVNAPRCACGRISSTDSEGLHRRVPRGVTTMGRLIRTGCCSMKSISCSSLHLGLPRSSSSYGVPLEIG